MPSMTLDPAALTLTRAHAPRSVAMLTVMLARVHTLRNLAMLTRTITGARLGSPEYRRQPALPPVPFAWL